jgi:beta-lactamase class A
VSYLNRRRLLALGAASSLAACNDHKLITPSQARPMDVQRLTRDFPALAERARPGAFSLGVMSLANTQTWYWDTDHAFPLAGAVAAPIAAAALALADEGKLVLSSRVAFNSLDLSPPASLIDQRFPDPPEGRDATILLSGLATLALRQGDNTAMDILMKQAGGPGGVGAFLEQKGVTGLRVDRYIREIDADLLAMPTFRAAWKDPPAFEEALEATPAVQRQAAMDAFIVDPRDTSTVPAALGFLALLADGKLVSPAATSQLLAWMDGPPGHRFRRGFADNVRLAQAAGATPTDLGFTAATAELAIATYPSGLQYAVAAFLTGSTATEDARDALFADAARMLAAAIG